MAHKKIIFVLVEGASEQTSLELLLSRLFDSQKVYFKIMHGDITAKLDIHPDNIVGSVGNIVKNWAGLNYVKENDFLEVVHLVDLDGAYIDDACIVKANTSKVAYTEKNIFCKNPEQIKKRNALKRKNIDRLCCTGKIWNSIPYRVYYMSSNLDHVLHNKLNSSEEEKENDAYDFVENYKNCLDDFVSFICDSDFSVSGSYKNTWDFVKKENRSLQRYTNLGLWLAKSKP